MADATTTKDQKRQLRDAALRSMNELAGNMQEQRIALRTDNATVESLYKRLCKSENATVEHLEQLRIARAQLLENGFSGSLPENLLVKADLAFVDDGEYEEPETDLVMAHGPPASGAAFRLRAKAFMLTFNALSMIASPETWAALQSWTEERAKTHKATFWSCTVEESTNSQEQGRVHAHVYFSWHGKSGIDHSTTNAWMFQNIRPRVDINRESRGPTHWLKATRHGHFYVNVEKLGTLFSNTNYPPWEGRWEPEAQWVTKLWRAHKLDHKGYLELSTRLRDGHDKRVAVVAAVVASEKAQAYASERKAARAALLAKQKPYMPLPKSVREWKASFLELEDRYRILVLHGRSRTGKSRWAKTFFQEEGEALVIECQQGTSPDLRDYDRSVHKAVIFDEVASPAFIFGNKKVFQSHVDGAKLGQSPTQQFAYEVMLWRTPLIVTTNKWNLDGYEEEDVEWLLANCVAVEVNEPVWLEAPIPEETQIPATRLRQWVPQSPAPVRSSRLSSELSPALSTPGAHSRARI